MKKHHIVKPFSTCAVFISAVVLFSVPGLAGALFAADVTLAWDQSDQSVQGYMIYYGTQSGEYTETVDAGAATQYTITDLAEGYIYYFAATAYNDSGESDYSQEIQYDTNDIDGDGIINFWDVCPSDPDNDADGDGICAPDDNCPNTVNPNQEDDDADGAGDACDECPADPDKVAEGSCGCGIADTDSDGDGTYDCNDGCPADPAKTAPGVCGCGIADTDSDGDGTCDCNDGCPNDPAKTAPGVCGCGVADTDSDGDGICDCNDGCPNDPDKTEPGVCGCGVADIDSDGDGIYECIDECPNDPAKTAPGVCGCGIADTDSDGDGICDCNDGCPNDPDKTAPGVCGCGIADTDSDGDGTYDCNDGCPNDPDKTAPGVCGCGVADTDSDGDGICDCNDGCPNDPDKTAPGVCGCGIADTDSDGDGTCDCNDGCPNDPDKTAPGVCGCGVADTDSDGDGIYDCEDNTPPEKPVLLSPADKARGVALRPELHADAFYDQDSNDVHMRTSRKMSNVSDFSTLVYQGSDDMHMQTTWQISRVSDFSTIVYETTSQEFLTSLTVPRLMLLPEEQYHWRVRFYDSFYEASEWSDSRSFSTEPAAGDQNSNGIPDDQEAGADADVDNDGVPDAEQSGIKTFLTCDAGCVAGIKGIHNVLSVYSAQSISSDSLEITENMPQQLLCGVMGFAATVSGDGDNATIGVYMSEFFDATASCYTYHSADGWSEYPSSYTVQEDGSSVMNIRIADGGPADADGTVNGRVVYFFGMHYESTPAGEPDSGDGDTAEPAPDTAGGGGGGGGSGTSGSDSEDGTGDTAQQECSSSIDCEGELVCDQQQGVCVPCLADSDCSDGLFCNGIESCVDNVCVQGASPCYESETCDDDNDMCVPMPPAPGACSADSDCDDGIFCNGQEICSSGVCEDGVPPCSEDQQCSEELGQCRDVITIPQTSILTIPFRPLFRDERCQWLVIIYNGDIDITAENTVISIEGIDDDFQGVEIDPDRSPRQYGNLIFVPICIDKTATTGTWTVLISTTANDMAGSYAGQIIEARFRMK